MAGASEVVRTVESTLRSTYLAAVRILGAYSCTTYGTLSGDRRLLVIVYYSCSSSAY